MSMSTPLNNLPLKTQPTNDETSDMNDPMVQDVLNEFQEELLISQKSSPQQMQHQTLHHQPNQSPQQMPQSISPNIPQQMNMYPQPTHTVHPSLPIQHNSPMTQPQFMNNKIKNRDDDKPFPYNLIDTEILQKTLIILIIIILTYSSNVLPFLYDKLPDYISDIIESYDFFIKSIFIFFTIYILFMIDLI
jgi:hypothetical protein